MYTLAFLTISPLLFLRSGSYCQGIYTIWGSTRLSSNFSTFLATNTLDLWATGRPSSKCHFCFCDLVLVLFTGCCIQFGANLGHLELIVSPLLFFCDFLRSDSCCQGIYTLWGTPAISAISAHFWPQHFGFTS